MKAPGGKLLPDESNRLLVGDLAGLRVDALRAIADKNFRPAEGQGIEKEHRPAQIVLHAAAAKRPARGGLDGDRLAGEWLIGHARYPVDRVLQAAGNREVVFRRVEDHAVGRPDRVGELLHRGGEAGRLLEVGIVERKFGKRRRFLDAHAGRRETGKRIHDHPVIGGFAQAAANADDLERLVGHVFPVGCVMKQKFCVYFISAAAALSY